MTAEELRWQTNANPCELVDGELHRMTPAGYEHGRICGNLTVVLGWYVRHNKLGVICTSETGFVLKRDPDTVRAPDLAFIAAENAPELESAFYPGAPDLAVEVVSPGDRVQEVEDKAGAWVDAGASLVWVVWPSTRSVSIHRPQAKVVTLGEAETLDGGQVVPGFTCPVREIFE